MDQPNQRHGSLYNTLASKCVGTTIKDDLGAVSMSDPMFSIDDSTYYFAHYCDSARRKISSKAKKIYEVRNHINQLMRDISDLLWILGCIRSDIVTLRERSIVRAFSMEFLSLDNE